VRQIDLLHERMAREGVDEDSMRKVAALRYKVSDASEASRLAPEVREILLKIFNQAMDICDALASFVAKVTKYISKVQLLLLDTESLFDKADDILFLRAIKTELALLG
jgi:hypothetical protein